MYKIRSSAKIRNCGGRARVQRPNNSGANSIWRLARLDIMAPRRSGGGAVINGFERSLQLLPALPCCG
jgi:hypothetical protein